MDAGSNCHRKCRQLQNRHRPHRAIVVVVVYVSIFLCKMRPATTTQTETEAATQRLTDSLAPTQLHCSVHDGFGSFMPPPTDIAVSLRCAFCIIKCAD